MTFALVPSRERWTPELLRAVIEGYGSPEPHPSGRTFHVTSPQNATKARAHHRPALGVSTAGTKSTELVPLARSSTTCPLMATGAT